MKKNLYLIGRSGLVSKYLKKNFKFKTIYSLRNINKIRLIKKKNNQRNIFILLSQPGGISFCEGNPKKVSLFLKKIDILLKQINYNAEFIFLSSDGVYSKKLKYGKLKLKIEKKIIKKFKKTLILRCCKIFSYNLIDKTEYFKVYKTISTTPITGTSAYKLGNGVISSYTKIENNLKLPISSGPLTTEFKNNVVLPVGESVIEVSSNINLTFRCP